MFQSKLFILTVVCLFSVQVNAQTHIKLNGVYACFGVINPAVEYPVFEKSTLQSEIVWSSWSSVTINGNSGPMKFGILIQEYRYYFKSRNQGWYVAGNAGGMIFNMAKPYWESGLRLQLKSSKGWGMMFGMAGGYEWQIGQRWIIDAFFGWSYMHSRYRGYSLIDGLIEGEHVYNKGDLILYPIGHEHDPLNNSAEWLPNKVGLSIGYRIFKK